MAFFNSLGRMVSEAGQKTVQKTKEFTETSRYNSMISDEEKKMNDTYFQLGKVYVSLHRDDYEDAFSELITSILESEEKIRSYQDQIHDIKGVQRCPRCGAEVPRGSSFCSSCGSAVPKVQSINTDEFIKCEKCGATLRKGLRFCTTCGNPVDQSTQAESSSTGETSEETSNKRVCPHCGASVDSDLMFCTECGSPIAPTSDESRDEVEVSTENNGDCERTKECPRCGATLEDGLAFCTECGLKI